VRKLKVSSRDLLFAFENRVAGVANYLDTETGEVLPAFTYNREQILAGVKKSPGRFVRLAPQSGAQAFKAMADFTRTVSRPALREQLEAALKEPYRFRTFRLILKEQEGERDRWHQFRGAMMVQVLSERLKGAGIDLVLTSDS